MTNAEQIDRVAQELLELRRNNADERTIKLKQQELQKLIKKGQPK